MFEPEFETFIKFAIVFYAIMMVVFFFTLNIVFLIAGAIVFFQIHASLGVRKILLKKPKEEFTSEEETTI